MNGPMAATPGIQTSVFGESRLRPDMLQISLAYNEMTVRTNGCVISRAEKLELRTRHGFCTRCEGVPIQLYVITKSRFNPLWLTREPRAVAGECTGGVCFICNPDRDPHRLHRRRAQRENNGIIGNTRGGGIRNNNITHEEFGSPGSRARGHVNVASAEIHSLSSPGSGARGHVSVPSAEIHSVSSPGSGARGHVSVPSAEIHSVSSGSNGSANSGERPPSHGDRSFPSPGNRRTRESPTQRPPLSRTSETSRATKTKVSWSGVYVPELMLESTDGNGSSRQKSSRSIDFPGQSSLHSDHGDASKGSDQVDSPSQSLQRRSLSMEELFSNGRPQRPSLSDSGEPDSVSTPPQSSLSRTEISSIVEGVDSLVLDMSGCGSSEFLADIVLGALREHVNVAKIQSHCLGIMWDLCKESDQSRSSMMSSGAPEDIIRALKTHTQDASVQEKGCGAMWSLGVSSSFRVMLVRASACQQIMLALQYFIATESLVKTAIGAMRTLSPEAEGRDIFLNLGASKAVVEAMVVHRGCVSIQRDACAFLSNVAVNIEKQFVTVVPQDELDAVVQAMANHRHEPSVMQGACFALKNYTHEEKNCRTLRRCNDIDKLIMYAAQFEQAPSCLDDASDVFERMLVSKTMDASLEDDACKTLQRITDSQINTPQGPRSILDFMRNYDWSPCVTAFCIQMLQQIASGDDGQIKNLFTDDVHRQILRFCLRFDEDASVCKSACNFLACAAIDASYRQQLVEAGAYQIIFKSFVCGRSDEELVLSGLKALESLLSVKECYDQFLDKMGLVTEAIAAHESSVSIQVLGTTLFSILDSPPS